MEGVAAFATFSRTHLQSNASVAGSRTALDKRPDLRRKLDSDETALKSLCDHLDTLTPEQRRQFYGASPAGALISQTSNTNSGDYDYAGSSPAFSAPSQESLEEASLFARRHLEAHGYYYSLLLEDGAMCDECHCMPPGVVDTCRSLAGDRLCFSCDQRRHEICPCCRERWILVRVDVAVGEKRLRDPDLHIPCYPRQLRPNEFVSLAGASRTDVSNIAHPTWIAQRVLPAPVRGTTEANCPSCKSFHCQPASWNGIIVEAMTVSERDHKWLAGKIISLQCRSCKTVFRSAATPASCPAAGYMSTTPQNTHSYMTTSALSTSVGQDMRVSMHQSDAAVQSNLGYGKFFDFDGVPVPLKPLRDNLRLYRTLMAFPIAVLMGFVFRCFVCGNSCCRLTGDACLKAFRYALGTSDVVFGLPNFVLAPVAQTDRAVKALRIARDTSDMPSSGCGGEKGTARFKAAECRPSRKPLSQHGMYACTCGHGCCEIAFEMHEPESITGHALLALVFAFAKGCRFLLNDIMCILRAHIAKYGTRSLQGALQALAVDSFADDDDATDGSIPDVKLQLRDGVSRLAEFVLTCDSVDSAKPSAGSSAGSVPSQPSDYDLGMLVRRLVERASSVSASSDTGTQSNSIEGAVPMFHAELHDCWPVLGAYAVPGVGAGHEVSEQLHAQVVSRNAVAATTMTATNYRLYHNALLSMFNQKRARDLAHGILVQFIRAMLALERRTDELEKLRAMSPSSRDTSDTALRQQAISTRALAAKGSGPSLGAASVASTPAQVELAVKSTQLAAHICYFQGIRDNINTAVTDDAAKASMLVAVLAASPVKLPGQAVTSVPQLDNALKSMRRSHSRMSKGLAGFIFSATNAVVVYLSKLHDLATEFARADQRIQIHVATSGSAGTDSQRLYKIRGSIRTKIDHCVSLLRQLGKLSTDVDIQRAVAAIPDVVSITSPDCLPTSVGSFVVKVGDVFGARLVDAYNARRAALDELQLVGSDVGAAIRNVDAVINQLTPMLESLTRVPQYEKDNPSEMVNCLQRGAGASGLWGGLPYAMFDLSRIQALSPRVKVHIAAGMAGYVAEGLSFLQEQRAQLDRLQTALSLLSSQSPSTASNGRVPLSFDKLKRAHAFRYGRKLLMGQITPAAWVAVSTGGTVPPRSVHASPRVIAHNSAVGDTETVVETAAAHDVECVDDDLSSNDGDSSESENNLDDEDDDSVHIVLDSENVDDESSDEA